MLLWKQSFAVTYEKLLIGKPMTMTVKFFFSVWDVGRVERKKQYNEKKKKKRNISLAAYKRGGGRCAFRKQLTIGSLHQEVQNFHTFALISNVYHAYFIAIISNLGADIWITIYGALKFILAHHQLSLPLYNILLYNSISKKLLGAKMCVIKSYRNI